MLGLKTEALVVVQNNRSPKTRVSSNTEAALGPLLLFNYRLKSSLDYLRARCNGDGKRWGHGLTPHLLHTLFCREMMSPAWYLDLFLFSPLYTYTTRREFRSFNETQKIRNTARPEEIHMRTFKGNVACHFNKQRMFPIISVLQGSSHQLLQLPPHPWL